MRLVLLFAFAVSMPVAAQTVFKCVDSSGKVTFTQQACPEQTTLSDVVSAHNQRPSADGDKSKMAEKRQSSGSRQQTAGNWNDPAPTAPTAPPALEPAPQEKQNKRACVGCEKSKPIDKSQQPCVKVVDKLVSRSYVDKNGQRVGGAEYVKVVVPCR